MPHAQPHAQPHAESRPRRNGGSNAGNSDATGRKPPFGQAAGDMPHNGRTGSGRAGDHPPNRPGHVFGPSRSPGNGPLPRKDGKPAIPNPPRPEKRESALEGCSCRPSNDENPLVLMQKFLTLPRRTKPFPRRRLRRAFGTSRSGSDDGPRIPGYGPRPENIARRTTELRKPYYGRIFRLRTVFPLHPEPPELLFSACPER